MTLTADEFRRIVHYDPETGDFTWLESLTRRKAGTKATKRPYVQFRVRGKLLYAHRLAWLYVHGEWPRGQLDHINGDPSDNHIANLRLATPKQNMANVRIHRDNKSGFKGVCQVKGGKFMASIKEGGKVKYIGLFDSAASAHWAYWCEARRIHGDFARAA